MKITIIGGGVGGVGAALELAEQNHEVTIIEMRQDLLIGSSDNTPCRLGLGFHYMDEETAIKYLRATIKLARKFNLFSIDKQFIISGDQDPGHAHRRGRYFIVKDSQFKSGQIHGLYEKLQKEYQNLINKDPANMIFGPAKDFYTELVVDDYRDHVNPEKVKFGIETAEHILNWPLFQKELRREVLEHPNITVLTNKQVTKVEHNEDDFGYSVFLKDAHIPLQNYSEEEKLVENKLKTNYQKEEKAEKADLTSNYIINATWERIEELNHSSGFFVQEGVRTNRLKVIIEIELPEGIEDDKPLNPMFFCFGPHCSFNNTGDGRGFLSFEPATNIEQSTSLKLPQLSKRLLYGHATDDEIRTYGERILSGAIEYMPILEGSKVINARFGIVKNKGEVNIYSSESGFHQRRESGVEEMEFGWLNNACMKLMYFLENAQEVKETVHMHDVVLSRYIEIIKNIKKTCELVDSDKLGRAIKRNLQQGNVFLNTSDPVKTEESLLEVCETVLKKEEYCKQIRAMDIKG